MCVCVCGCGCEEEREREREREKEKECGEYIREKILKTRSIGNYLYTHVEFKSLIFKFLISFMPDANCEALKGFSNLEMLAIMK